MKNIINLIVLIKLLLLVGCSSDEAINAIQVREINATLNGFTIDENVTRTSYYISETTGFETVWSTGDILGIYPIGGDQVSFPISSGVGSTTAKFDGGSWALRGDYKYAAYYPFSKDCYTIDQTAIPVSFQGQVQNGNNSTAHLASVDFMAAAGTQPFADGSVNLQLKHIGCFLRMQLTMPEAGTFTEVNISTNEGVFITKGIVNLAATTPTIVATKTASSITLGLNNVKTTSANQTITLYMMVAPNNMNGKILTFVVKDSNNNVYTQTAAGKDMVATYAYNYALTFVNGRKDPFNGHEYVDLGLKDEQGRTLYWATCNLGANDPSEFGKYYAWGEIDGHDRHDNYAFNWLSACFNNNSSVIDEQYFTSIISDIAPDGNLSLEYDAARQNWGGSWRMPTKKELEQLINECGWTYTSLGGWEGYKVSDKNDDSKYIFLIAAGLRDGTELDDVHFGYYSSSTYYGTRGRDILFFRSQSLYYLSSKFRYMGLSIRPVCVIDN